MSSHLVDASGPQEVALDRAALERLRERSDFYWLDLHGAAEDEIALLGEVFGFHPLAVEDATHFGQRPKLDVYDGYVLLVAFGAAPDEDDLVEVHCFYSERFLVTVRRDSCPAFRDVRDRYARRPGEPGDPVLVLHRVVDSLVDSFFPLLADFDDFIDAVEEGIFASPDEEQLRRVFLMKRRLVTLRKVVSPQRDLMATVANGVAELPGMSPDAEHHFRDVYDHLIRLTDVIDSYRDLLTGVSDVYLSTVSNRLNAVMKQLAVIATIFLPLSFVTGFFGQNFGWMVDRIAGPVPFVGLGIGIELAALAVLVVYFRRRGWLSSR
jgi:magnesium transporter